MIFKQHIKRFYYVLIFLIFSSQTFAQHDNKEQLSERILQNKKLLNKDTEKAFAEIEGLMEEAVKTKNSSAELALMANICRYHLQKMDFDKLTLSTDQLLSKAEEYNNKLYQAVSYNYLMDIYIHNELQDKAVSAFELCLKTAGEIKEESPDVIAEIRANAYIGYANMFKNEPEKIIQYLRLANSEFLKISDSDERKHALYGLYANIAGVYAHFNYNLDSAEYYVNSSFLLAPEDNHNNFAYKNYSTIGRIYQNRKEYEKAIENYKIAEEKAMKIGFTYNKLNLYSRFIETYEAMGDSANVSLYQQKAKDVRLEIVDSKNHSLHKVIQDQTINEQSRFKNYLFAYIGSGVVFMLLISVLVYRLRKKNRILTQQEKASREYLKEIKFVQNEQTYAELVEMAKSNNPAFLTSFHEVFPKFTEQLLSINPNLAKSEIEFCAYLKLNLSSKEVANIKSIELRSAQNRKNRLRKRLNIPQNIDIYHWFNNMEYAQGI